MTASRTIAYQPALDGLRAVAVGLVLVFHGGFSWLTGGYVGVSLFFTLSGYLITTLLLVEHERSGTIRLGAFYSRRMKRLLPASTLCLAAVVAGAAAGWFDHVTTLRRDLLGSLFQVANWVKLFGDESYAELTNATLGRVAPLEHYWSLAIEEQFYWIWPLTMLGLLRLARSRRAAAGSLVGLAVAGIVAAPVVAAVWGPDAAYWATPARIGEILVGAALAGVSLGRPAPRWAAPAAPVGLAVVLWASLTWPAGRGPAYDGWLPVFAVASAALIWGLQRPSPLRTALAWRPVVWIGSVSYGLYLYHWPVFAVLTTTRTSLDGTALFAVRLAVTVAIAALSSWLLELPVRRWVSGWRPVAVAAAFATVAVAVASVVFVNPVATESADLDDAEIVPVDGSLPPLATVTTAVVPGTGEPGTSGPATSSPATTTTTTASIEPVPVPAVTRPVRIIVAGDSTAEWTAVGLVDWAGDHPDTARVSIAATAGCGLLRSGTVPTDGAIDWESPCEQLLDVDLPAALDRLQPDVVMLMVTMRDVEDRIWDDAEGVLSPFDERFRARLLADYRAITESITAAGVPRVAWVLPPRPIAPFEGDQRVMRDPARYEVQYGVIAEVASAYPESVRVLDMNGWLDATGRALDVELRPDGLHWTAATSRWVSDVYLAGSLVAAAVS